jgi:hypothetical protein
LTFVIRYLHEQGIPDAIAGTYVGCGCLAHPDDDHSGTRFLAVDDVAGQAASDYAYLAGIIGIPLIAVLAPG